MIIDGTVSSDKTEFLVDKFASLLNSGVDASKILVLVSNSNTKKSFLDAAMNKITVSCFENLQIHSYFSLVYNTVNDNWAFLENINPYPNPKILPNLTGLEVSQYILKDIIHSINFKGYNSKKSLLHQLFRRYSLIIQNDLSDADVELRSKILQESFADDAKLALKKFLKQTLYLRDFDYLRQELLFKYIYKNSDYFKNIEYLILDDGDEITPACYSFIEYLRPQLKDWMIAFDKKGASRIGYLSADKTAVWEFEKLFNESTKSIESKTKLKFDAENIYLNVINDEKNPLEFFKSYSPSKRSKMLELACEKIEELIKENVSPSEISVITPIVDDMLRFTLKENLPKSVIPIYITGNEKLIQNRLVHASINILKLNTKLRASLSEFDIRSILVNCLDIPIKYCRNILLEFEKTKNLPAYVFENPEYTQRYDNLINLVNNILPQKEKLSEQVYEIYSKLMNFITYENHEVTKFNFFIKQLEDFEKVFCEDFHANKEDIITQIENSIISENPYSTLDISHNNIIIGTPQKIIDNQIKTRYQFWLDVSSDEWIKSDTGPLYNAWVFQKGWDKEDYTVDDNIQLGREKTGRVLRKLTLCAKEGVFSYSSLFDGNGIENYGGIEKCIITKTDESDVIEQKSETFEIVPRQDQKPVLDYEGGHMAISAVPGAGKTTILLALIIKLLNKGINPQNIFVMTYMESAARNFRERIKSVRENSSQLPYISTIHGLALRILKENANFERIGLNSDFEICDDTQKTRIIKEVNRKVRIKEKELQEFVQGISVFKLSQGSFSNLNNKDQKLKSFRSFYECYQATLSMNNLIDYDDILIMAVKLLEDNEDIRNYYQNICQYIIEDEAQDSSSVQQRLINLLSGKYKNLVRCGDVNQAITTTFTNADVKGFRKFIDVSQKVSMNCSQRCTEDVWQLANKLVLTAEKENATKDAFYHILMEPVPGENPICENAVQMEIFDTPANEKKFILKEIKNSFKNNPKSTIGILVRNNRQVNEWTNFIANNGLKCITRSECLEQKAIFRAIYAVLNIILSPFDNKIAAASYETLAELGFYNPAYVEMIEKSQTPFIENSPDNIPVLSQFIWDLNYWANLPHYSADELAIKIGLYYFSSEIEKSNIYLISTLIKRLSFESGNLHSIVERLGELAKRTSLSGFKFFSEEDESDKEIFEGKVQVMTLHKSKGDEFDVVFLPEMCEKNLPIDFYKLKSKSTDFVESLKALNSAYKQKSNYELKQDIIAENLRLLYVAITRAKRNLYITTSKKVKQYGKYKYEEPNKIFLLK